MLRVLFVDDEPFLLSAMRTRLRRHRDTWAMRFVEGPAAALEALAKEPADVIVSDMNMPCMLGTELYVLSPRFVPIALALSLEVVDPTSEQQVHAEVERALLRYLWALPPGGPRGAGWPRGKAVEINELRTQAGRVEGVEAVNALRLFYRTTEQDPPSWRELTGAQALTLLDFELPELMAVSIRPGEDRPAPPRGFGPEAGAAADGPRPVPVPVIPELC